MNFKQALLLAAIAVALPPPAISQNAQSSLAEASKAMGGDGLTTLQYSGSGHDFVMGQAFSPNDPWPRFIVQSYIRSIDYRAPASRDQRVRRQFENPPRGGGLQPIIGERRADQTIAVNASTPWAQQLDIWMTPHGFLKAAAAADAVATSRSIGGKSYTVITFTGKNGAAVSGYLNGERLVERVETRIDNPMLGDMAVNAVYSDYRSFGNVKFPTHIVQSQGDYPVLDVTINDVKANTAVDIPVPVPAAGAEAAQPATADQRLPTEKLADGVYLILGAGAASIALDFGEYSVVIEAPQGEGRAAAVIAETRQLIPNKPIRYVINTHHHFDHASGLRAFVAQGATIVTQQQNRSYFERIFAPPHTLNPSLDAVQKGPLSVKVEPVGEKKVMTGGNQVIELHHLQGNLHNAGLLIAYLPRQKILIQADMWGPQPAGAPPAPVNTYTQNFLENLDRLQLDIERIVPIHYPADRRVTTMADMMKAVGRAP